MKVRLNIIEPWESGTESTIDATIVKQTGKQFLLFIKETIKVRNEDAHYFVCLFKNEKELFAFENHEKGAYPIQMVFDKNIKSIDSELSDFSTYRSNFLSGELIIL